MKKVSEFIFKYRKIFLFAICIIFAICIVGTVFLVNSNNKINSDMVSYLNDNSITKKGIQFMQQEFNIRGNATLVVRVDEKDPKNLENLNAAISNVSKIKIDDKEAISNIAWYGLLDSYSYIKDNINSVVDNLYENKNKYLTIAEKLSDAGYFKNLDDLKSLLDITEYKDKEIITTKAMQEFLRQETKEENVYDYIILVMSNIDAGDAEYELLDKIKSEFSSFQYASTGTTETAQRLLNETMKDLPWFILASVLIVIAILFITSPSFIEPIILLTTLLVGIIISMGINYLYPSISIISFALGAVLQLAITMDYAVFFMHTYRKNRQTLDLDNSIINSIPESAMSIIASALTTIGGFIALYFMQFKIGTDVANVLIKGILTSMISVLILQPILTYMMNKLIDKTTHNFISSFTNKINKNRIQNNKKEISINKEVISKPIAKFSIKTRIILVLIAIALIAPAYIYQSKVQYSYLNLYEKSYETEEDILADEVGNQLILAVPIKTINNKTHQNYIDDINNINKDRISGVISAFTNVKIKPSILISLLNLTESTTSINDLKDYLVDDTFNSFFEEAGITQDEKDVLLELVNNFEQFSKDTDLSMLNQYFNKINDTWYTLYTISFSGNTEDAEAQKAYTDIIQLTSQYFGNDKFYPTGMITSSFEMSQITPKDFLIVTLVSIAIIYLIVTILLRNPLKSLIIVAIIELSIWINLAITYFSGIAINFVVYIIISSVQLGCTVDYAILFANTFESNREKYKLGKECALYTSISTIMPITQSALLIASVCFSLFLISSNLIIKQLTEMLSRGALLSYILVILLMPAIWSFFKTEKKKFNYAEKIKNIDSHITKTNTVEEENKEIKQPKQKESIESKLNKLNDSIVTTNNDVNNNKPNNLPKKKGNTYQNNNTKKK